MDHLRWNLVEGVRGRLDERIRAFVADDNAYLELLKALIREGVEQIEKDDLVVEVNARDHGRLASNWDQFSSGIADGKKLALADEPIQTVGGAVVSDRENRIRLVNTFEGRQERLESRLHQVIIERLLPGDAGITTG
jgi:V/A-type H+-transporting ATPase subunit E